MLTNVVVAYTFAKLPSRGSRPTIEVPDLIQHPKLAIVVQPGLQAHCRIHCDATHTSLHGLRDRCRVASSESQKQDGLS